MNKVNFSLRMSESTNEFVTAEAERLGMSKSAFLHFLIGMYRKEQEDSNLIKYNNEQVIESLKQQLRQSKDF